MPTRKAAKSVPQSEEEVDRDVVEIGRLDRQIADIENELSAEQAKLAEDAAKNLKPLQDLRSRLHDRVQSYAESHRDELTRGGKTKSFKLPSGGVLQWRKNPPRLVVGEKATTIIGRLKRAGHGRFVRSVETLDKEALIQAPDIVTSVRGLRIDPGSEQFSIKPNQK